MSTQTKQQLQDKFIKNYSQYVTYAMKQGQTAGGAHRSWKKFHMDDARWTDDDETKLRELGGDSGDLAAICLLAIVYSSEPSGNPLLKY